MYVETRDKIEGLYPGRILYLYIYIYIYKLGIIIGIVFIRSYYMST